MGTIPDPSLQAESILDQVCILHTIMSYHETRFLKNDGSDHITKQCYMCLEIGCIAFLYLLKINYLLIKSRVIDVRMNKDKIQLPDKTNRDRGMDGRPLRGNDLVVLPTESPSCSLSCPLRMPPT